MPDAPLLEIDRVAVTINGRPVEWRVSRCNTTDYTYVAERG
jgi:GntR family transcriptional regulator